MTDEQHKKLLDAATNLISILGCQGDCLLVPQELVEEDELLAQYTDAFSELSSAISDCRNS